jgi:hypothetical protein
MEILSAVPAPAAGLSWPKAGLGTECVVLLWRRRLCLMPVAGAGGGARDRACGGAAAMAVGPAWPLRDQALPRPEGGTTLRHEKKAKGCGRPSGRGLATLREKDMTVQPPVRAAAYRGEEKPLSCSRPSGRRPATMRGKDEALPRPPGGATLWHEKKS